MPLLASSNYSKILGQDKSLVQTPRSKGPVCLKTQPSPITPNSQKSLLTNFNAQGSQFNHRQLNLLGAQRHQSSNSNNGSKQLVAIQRHDTLVNNKENCSPINSALAKRNTLVSHNSGTSLGKSPILINDNFILNRSNNKIEQEPAKPSSISAPKMSSTLTR